MLQDGLYEQIVNNAIDAELAAIDKHIETTAIDSSEAPKALVQYIAETARQAFESLRDQRDSLDKQIALANRIVHAIAEGVEAQPLVRKIVGPTEPKSAEMGTIRGDYSHMSFGYSDAKGTGVPNLVHASGSIDEAKKEIDLWFNANELYDYSDLNEKYTR